METNLGSPGSQPNPRPRISLGTAFHSDIHDSLSITPSNSTKSGSSQSRGSSVQFGFEKPVTPIQALIFLSDTTDVDFILPRNEFDAEIDDEEIYKRITKAKSFPQDYPKALKSSFSKSPKFTSYEPGSAKTPYQSKFSFQNEEISKINFENFSSAVQDSEKVDEKKKEIMDLINYCKKINPKKKRDEGVFANFSIEEFRNFMKTQSN